MTDREAAFARIYRTNHWGGKESRSGEGSSLAATANLRQALPELIEKFGITSMLDVPCGDWNWMSRVPLMDLGVTYTGMDIVPEVIEENRRQFGENTMRGFWWWDMVDGPCPDVDLILCRDLLQHLPTADVHKVLSHFLKSRSKYLLVTSYRNTTENKDISAGEYRPLNLFIAPFMFSSPIQVIDEGGLEKNEPDKAMYLFSLEAYRG